MDLKKKEVDCPCCDKKAYIDEYHRIWCNYCNLSKTPKKCLEIHKNGDICPICSSSTDGKKNLGYWRRQKTQYVNVEDNWYFACEIHHDENEEYWGMMWDEYYSSILF